MAVLSVILGILLILAGIFFIAGPLQTFLMVGLFVSIFLLVYGVAGLVKVFQKKAHVLEAIVSVLAIIIGIVVLVVPGGQENLDGVLLILVAIWFIVQGVVSLVVSIQARPEPGYVWGIVAGVLGILVGILCFARPLITALVIGILVGIMCIEAGVSLIAMAGVSGSDDE